MAKTDDADEAPKPGDISRVKDSVENANAADEESKDDEKDQDDEADKSEEDDSNAENEDDSEDSEDEDSDEEDESDEEDDDDKSKAKKGESKDFKYKKYVDSDPTKHVLNLEKALSASGSEAVRIKTELDSTNRRLQSIVQAAARDPKLAEQLNKVLAGAGTDAGGGKDDDKGKQTKNPLESPFISHAQAEWREKSEKEVSDILDANPEIGSDPDLGKQVKHWMDVFSDQEFELTGKVITAGKAMEMAMKHLGIEDSRTKQKTAKAAKDLAAPTRPRGTKHASKETSKKPVSEDAYKFGAAMGVSRDKVEKYAQ